VFVDDVVNFELEAYIQLSSQSCITWCVEKYWTSTKNGNIWTVNNFYRI